jgi:hypothetical protein
MGLLPVNCVPFHGSKVNTSQQNEGGRRISTTLEHLPLVGKKLEEYLVLHPNLVLLLPNEQINRLCLINHTHPDKHPDKTKTPLLMLYLNQVMNHEWEDYENPIFREMDHYDLLFGRICVSFRAKGSSKIEEEELIFLGNRVHMKKLDRGQQITFWQGGTLKTASLKGLKIIDHSWRFDMENQITDKHQQRVVPYGYPFEVVEIRYVDKKFDALLKKLREEKKS